MADEGSPSPGWGKSASGPKTWTAGARTDDPTKRTVHAPLAEGCGTGRAFLFLFGLKKHSPMDRVFLNRELASIEDDVALLRGLGFTVVVDSEATRKDFLETITGNGEGVKGLAPTGFYWSGHGNPDGSLEASDGGLLRPEDCDPAAVHPGLRLVVLGSCYVGSRARTWRSRLGGNALVVGWGRPVTIDRAVEFLTAKADTETDFDDLVRRYVIDGAPIPVEAETTKGAPPSALAQGRREALDLRVRELGERLGAEHRAADRWHELSVPLADGRRHLVKITVVDASFPHAEGEPLVACEADAGEISPVLDLVPLLASFGAPGYTRLALVAGDAEIPRLAVQGFIPLSKLRASDLAALAYEAASRGDRIEQAVFGGDFSR